MAPTHVHLLLNQLPSYFDGSVSIDHIDRLCEERENGSTTTPANSDNSDESDAEHAGESSVPRKIAKDLRSLPMVKRAIRDSELLDLMRDMIREVENIRNTAGLYDQYDNWQYLSKKMNIDHFLSFIYALICLAELYPTETTHRNLAICSARLYIVSLSTPGQKQTTVFNEQVFAKGLDVFKLIDRLPADASQGRMKSTNQVSRLLLDYISMLEDLQLLLRCMTLKNCVSSKIQLIETFKNLLIYCIKHAHGRPEAEQMAENIFKTLSIICLPEHDDHNQCSTTIRMILNKTAVFYSSEYKNVSSAFRVHNVFLRLLEQNPPDTCEVLSSFIKAVLTNPPKVFARPDDYAILLDAAVRYELVMYRKCNVSIVDYLKQIETHAETSARINIVEMIARLAVVDCSVDWELFQSEISNVPREIELIKLLHNKLMEKSNTVKLKAFQCLLKILQNGNKTMKQIFRDAFYSANADEDEKNYLQMNDFEELFQTAELELGISRNFLNFGHQPSSSGANESSRDKSLAGVSESLSIQKLTSDVPGINMIEDILTSLPNAIYDAMQSPMSAIRRVALSCLECIVELSRNRIDEPIFDHIVTKLAKDPVMLMRRTTLNVLNKLIALYPNYLPLIKLWSKCLLFFLDDVDQKLKESAMESLKTNVFDNICRYEDSSSRKVFTPWMIVRSILVIGKINVLKSAVDSWIQKSILTAKNLSIIESHIFTVNCSEAWIILAIIANKMKSKNPDLVIKTMNDILQQDTYNSPICLQYILSVIKSWLSDFTRPGLNQLFKILSDLLRTGSTNISLVGDIYSLCCMIKEKADGAVHDTWITGIRDSSAEYLLHFHSHYTSAHVSNERYLISLLVYAEAATDLNVRPDSNILSILLNYLARIAADEKVLLVQTSQTRKINVTIIVLARFGLRDGSLASTVIADFNKILKFKNIHHSILCTLITAFADLCKRHTSLVDSSITTVIGQLSSRYLAVRSVALSNLNELILQDYVKMRGVVLLNILKLIIDEDDHIAAQAFYVIQLYVNSKNEKLLKVSFLECVYVFNNYLKYAASDMFPASDLDNEDCDLAGSDERSQQMRCAIYDFFVHNIDDMSLLKLLKNVNKIHQQLSKGTYIECAQGVGTLIDLIYVFKCMCGVRNRDKAKLSKGAGTTEDETHTTNSDGNEGPSAKKSRLKAAQTQHETEVTTIAEKMIAVYCLFQQEVRKYVQKIAPTQMHLVDKRLEELSLAIAGNFRTLVEFAKPMNFWRSLLKVIDSTTDSKRKRSKQSTGKNKSDDESACESDDEEESADDLLDLEAV
ncbi:condensin-2 complex subunit D3 [Anopheles marshallii]|uniref:condensin-2 complex subunit D3 n=1 Tax=Anopheles marshallii TaxID=1521116 RepID=UPI00237A5EDD|nr:condensin-2 complex subunit D3 [Anopheles marshallii]